MSDQNREIQDTILLAALEDVPFDSWTWSVIEQAAQKKGYDSSALVKAFPNKLLDVLIHFSDWADRQMLVRLNKVDNTDIRIRDRVRQGVAERIDILQPYKEAFRSSASFWLNPLHKFTAGKIVWRTADEIWIWAGDTATDYNHYSKRALLSGVITSTMLAWLRDDSDNSQETLDFLDRRIDNVLKFGRVAGKVIGKFKKEKATS